MDGNGGLEEGKGSRAFGLVLAVLFALVGRKHGYGWFYASGLVAAVALLKPALLGPIERRWMRLAEAIGRVNTFIILVVVYYLLLTPVALVLRLLGDDALDVRGPKRGSYWRPHKTGDDLTAYERQY